MLQMFYWILHYIFFINLPIDLSIYLFIYPLKSKIVRVLNKGRAEQQKRNIQLNLLVSLPSLFCCVFIGFTNLLIFFWKVQHMHPVKRISFVTPDPDDEKIFGYVCSQPDSSTGYKFYALKSGNVRGTKEIICFIN